MIVKQKNWRSVFGVFVGWTVWWINGWMDGNWDGKIVGESVSVVGNIVGIFVACPDGEMNRKFEGDNVGYFVGEIVTLMLELIIYVTIVGVIYDGDIVAVMLGFNDGVFVCVILGWYVVYTDGVVVSGRYICWRYSRCMCWCFCRLNCVIYYMYYVF